MEQTIAGWQAGYYALSFKAAQRDYPDNLQSFGVMLDGDILGTFTPSGTDYETIVTNAFYAVAGYHTFRIYGLNETDDTVFLDDFRLVPVLGDGFNTPLGSASTITLDATVRDFTADHPDFQVDADPFVVPGLVAPELGEDGKPVFAGPDGGGGITDASTFAQWYEQVDGVNESTTLALTLTETSPGSGVYEYATSHFFPIDGQLLGNEGDAYTDPFGIPHNFHFTAQVSTQFTYLGGETYNFWSDDDLWVFIDGKLAVDLGGLHPGASQSVSLDSLGLGIGQTYSFDLFYAERHDHGANFRMQVGTEVV
jgi:fibro-slime domain-containing protein